MEKVFRGPTGWEITIDDDLPPSPRHAVFVTCIRQMTIEQAEEFLAGLRDAIKRAKKHQEDYATWEDRRERLEDSE